MSSDERLFIWQGDITTLKCDAIVNACNSQMLGCFAPLHSCIDNFIHTYAGIELRMEMNEIMTKQGHEEETGKAKITSGYNLPAKYILHTVGPIIEWEVTKEDEKLLASCYKECLKLAADTGVESIAFCCLSTGVFRFPQQRAAEIATATVKEFLEKDNRIKKVIFNVFKDTDLQIYKKLLKEIKEMEELILVQPSEKYFSELSAYRKEFLDRDDSMDGCGPLRRFEDMKDYLELSNRYLKKETVPEGLVVATQFLCIRKSDNRLVGMIQVRHYFNDFLEKYAGNIGYSVRPSERRKGYASWMLENVKPFCRSIGLKKILISCLDTNEGSRKTILKNGGVYENTVFCPDDNVNLERYWIDLK